MSALVIVARKNFNYKFTAKNWFSDSAIIVITIADADIGSIKSLHALFVKHLDHVRVNFEQNRKVRTIKNFELFDKKWTIFDKVLTPFCETFL